MIPMKTFWCEDTPTLEDILAAYQEVQQGSVVISPHNYRRYD